MTNVRETYQKSKIRFGQHRRNLLILIESGMCLLIKWFYQFYSNYDFVSSCHIYNFINDLKEIDRRIPVIPIRIQLLNFFWKRIYFLVPSIKIVLGCNWLAWIYLQTHPIIFLYSYHKSEVIIIQLFERKVWKIVCNNNIFKNFRNMNSKPNIKYFYGFVSTSVHYMF